MFARAFFVGFELFYLCCSALCGSFWRVFSKVSLVFLSVFVAISHSPKNSKTVVFIVFSAIWASPGQLPDSSRTAHGHQKSIKKSLKIDQGRSRNPGRKAPRGGEGATRKTPPRGLLEISQCSTEFSESRQGAPQLLGGQSTSQASEKPQCSIAHRSQSLKIWHDCLHAALYARAACLLNRLDPDVAK